MKRSLLKVVTVAEVLRAAPQDPATQVATAREGGHLWALWEFDHEAVGEIGGQDVVPPHEARLVKELNESRLTWMKTAAGAKAQANHSYLLGEFAKGDYLTPPVLIYYPVQGWTMQIRDGAHRIFAAYEYTSERRNRRLRVYWNRVDDLG